MWIIFLALLFGGSDTDAAKTDAELKAEFIRIALTCVKDRPVEVPELLKLKAMKVPTDPEVKCLLACAYRKYGTLNDKGTFDLDKLHKLVEESKEGDEKQIANGKKVFDICEKVNEESVSDGNKGCERATLFFACVVGTAPKFGFTI